MGTIGDLPPVINVLATPAVGPAVVRGPHRPGIGAAFWARGSVSPQVARIYPTETLHACRGWRPLAERRPLLEPPSEPA
jgi:hypothetical protein